MARRGDVIGPRSCGALTYRDAEFTKLEDCTGWDWKPPKPEPDTSLEADIRRLYQFVESHKSAGCCRILSKDRCGCILCSRDRIIAAAWKWNEANNGWQVTTLEDADQYSYDGVQWSPIETCPIYNTPPLMFRRRIK